MINKYIYIVGISEFASRMNFIAMTAMLFSYENTAIYLTVFFLVRQIGGIVTSFIINRFIKQLGRKRVMVWSDIASGCFILLPLVFQHPLAICVSAFFLGCTYEMFYISYSASIPDMVGKQLAQRTNAKIVRISSAVSIIGFLIGGWLSEFFGYSPIIIFDSLSYFLAAFILARLYWDENMKEDDVSNHKVTIDGSFPKNDARKLIVIFSFIAFFYSLAISGFNYSLPFLASSFSYDSFMNGVFWSMTSIGSLLGASIKGRATLNHYLVWLIVMSISISAAFSFKFAGLIMIFLLVSGLFDGLAQVSGRTVLQHIPGEQRGSAFAIQAMFTRLGFLVGFIVCPFLAVNFDLNGSVWIVQALLCSVCMIFLYYHIKEGTHGKNSRGFI